MVVPELESLLNNRQQPRDLDARAVMIGALISARRDAAAASLDQAQARAEEAEYNAYDNQLKDATRRLGELTIKTPIDGELVAPEIDQTVGRYFNTGEEIAMVQNRDVLRIRGTVNQDDAQLVFGTNHEARTEVRLVGDIDAIQLGSFNTSVEGRDCVEN